MKFLGFYPETAAARIRAATTPPRVPSLRQSLSVGGGGFCLIGVVVFAIVAVSDNWLKHRLGEIGSYAVYSLLFIFLAAGLFRRLVVQPAPVFRFYVLFAAAFMLYSAGWTTGYSLLRSWLGEWFGSLLAATALGLTLAAAFDAPKQAFKVIVFLFLALSAGYFPGEFIHHALPGNAGWLLWGAAYGLGLGIGLGYSLYACQEPLRERLKTAAPAGATTTSRR